MMPHTIFQRPLAWFMILTGLLLPIMCLGQTYNPIYAPLMPSAHAWVYCYNINSGQIFYNCPVFITTAFYSATNGHFHYQSGQPRSSISCINSANLCNPVSGLNINANTASLGSVEVYTTGSLVGQAERLVAYPNGNPGAAAHLDYAVGYNDVFYNDHPELWKKIGGSETGGNTGHGTTAYNRWMQLTNPPYYNTGPAYGLYYASLQYQQDHGGIVLCANDMALPFGGKFDICSYSPPLPSCSGGGYFPWQSPHSQHDRGTAADIAGTGSAQCANAGGSGVNITEFITYCVANGALSAYSFNEGNHAHCGFDDPNSWPH
jgi:hypothetical protein